MARDVFISYKSEEYNDALWLYENLRKEGISSWMAPQDIPGGSSYAKEITHAIKGCKVFVLLLSNAAQESQWIPKEIDNAINENKLILPFMVEKCELNPEFTFYLSNIQFKEAYKNKEAAWQELLGDIKAYLASIGEETEEIEEPAEGVISETKSTDAPVITPAAPAKAPDAPAEKAPSAPVKTSDTSPSKKEKKKNKANSGNKSKKKLIGIITAVFAVIIAAVIIISALPKEKTVTIADKEFEIDTYSIRLEDTTIEVYDLDTISFMENVSNINFVNCTINATNLNSLARERLSTLNLSGCDITQKQLESIDFTALTKLSELNLSQNPDITSIPDFSSIEESVTILNISGTSIKDISFLENCSKLRILNISALETMSLEALTKCIYIEKIFASNNGLTSTKGLENCTLINEADLSGNEISDIAFLEKSASKLTKLNLANNKISDISVLKNCTLISVLNVENNEIESLSAISNMKNLANLDASGNKLTKFSDCNSEKLVNLDLSDNQIESISALNFVDNSYVTLHLQNNKITELNADINCTYTELFLEGNPLSSLEKLQSLMRISQLTLDYNDTFDFNHIKDNTYKLILNNCPLDKQVEIKKMIFGTEFKETAE